MIVGDGSLLLHPGRGAAQSGDFWGGLILPAGVLGELIPDRLLKVGGLHIVDGENGRETQLADDLTGRCSAVMDSGTLIKEHG